MTESETAPETPATAALVTEDHVREALKNVIDPELHVNIVDLGLIYLVDIRPVPDRTDGVQVYIEMTMTSPMCPAGPQLVGGAKENAGAVPGVVDVDVKVVMDPPWTPDRMTEEARDELGMF
jgi:metal-sulfur cluster biosynthetic enzyme